MSVQFRKAVLQDIPDIKEIAKRVIRENYTSFLGSEMANEFIESGMSDKEIDDGINFCTVMTVDEVIVGFSIVNNDLLHLIMIDVPYQNNGYGGMLLTYVEKYLFKKYNEIHLQTFEENTKTKQFYLKNNWIITDKQTLPEINKTMLFFTKTMRII